jgi:intracellular sulfur oxidation DsrE/DsrF family protein
MKGTTIVLSLLVSIGISAQKKSKGPVITGYGEVYPVENADYKTKSSEAFKAVFDIMDSPESHEEINRSIETAARFLNMHAQGGVPVENLKIALVLHNKASKDVMDDDAYRRHYGTDNPNKGLIQALLDSGGQVIFCGQSSNARGIPKEDLIPGIQLSLSAMTALIQLQNENYKLIKF